MLFPLNKPKAWVEGKNYDEGKEETMGGGGRRREGWFSEIPLQVKAERRAEQGTQSEESLI